MNTPLSHVLLDIEGTTCPVRFVSETLFPYAAAWMGPFLEGHQDDQTVQELLTQVEQAWRQDQDPAAHALLQTTPAQGKAWERLLPYLHWLIDQDRKLTPLKDLQGLIWEEGYASGALQGPLYPDVAPALRRWRATGLKLAVYSSGSVKAQQLIYGYSNVGDLRSLFEHWFDTRIGSKLEPESYSRIASALNAEAKSVLFISDSYAELEAARASGMASLLCERSGSPTGPISSDDWAKVYSFDTLDPGQQCG